MKAPLRFTALAPLCLALCSTRPHAQLVSDGETNFFSGTTNMAAASLSAPYGDNTLLVITNGGIVTNTTGTIGFNAGADDNAVVVTGLGSRWFNSGSLTIGSNGARSRLLISDGGQVFNTF
jgi:T5SS/PEP-CTERM-associated repeat protein